MALASLGEMSDLAVAADVNKGPDRMTRKVKVFIGTAVHRFCVNCAFPGATRAN